MTHTTKLTFPFVVLALAACARPMGPSPATTESSARPVAAPASGHPVGTAEGVATPPQRAQPLDAEACSQPFPAVMRPAPEPPFSGTSFMDPNMLTSADPSSLVSLTYMGRAERTMFDRRTNSFNPVNAHVFDARFGTAVSVEVQVNPEFTQPQAESEARFYATAVRRLPAFLFRDIRTLWIHAGHFPFGGGNENLLIHTTQGAEYVQGGFLEEILLHESTHTSLDAYHASTPRWQEAQRADGVALSAYARDNPQREDLAETLGPYLALRFWSDRIPAATTAAIQQAIPNRITYLDCLGLSIAPLR